MKVPAITLHNADCLPAMREMVDGQFDLAIVDPPYNIVSEQARGIGSRIDATGKMNEWNNEKPSAEYFEQLFRTSEHQIIWGANNFTLPESEYFIVWNKMQTVPNFASAELAYTNVRQPAQIFDYSIHQHNASKGEKIHPTQKPVALYKWLLRNYAKPGDTILDTHLGSGSIAIACHDYGFDLVGYELDKDYYDAAVLRLDNHRAQMKLEL